MTLILLLIIDIIPETFELLDNKIYNSHKVEVRQKNISSTKNKEEISNSKVERKPSNNHPWKRMKI